MADIRAASMLSSPKGDIKSISAYNEQMEKPPRRFVVLHHLGHGPEHWDLMLEVEGKLVTWQILRDPRGATDAAGRPEALPARRIGDHRLAYLSYEGPVSAGRGTVRRIDQGTCEPVEVRDDRWRVRFDGRVFLGWYLLTETEGHGNDWLIQRE